MLKKWIEKKKQDPSSIFYSPSFAMMKLGEQIAEDLTRDLEPDWYDDLETKYFEEEYEQDMLDEFHSDDVCMFCGSEDVIQYHPPLCARCANLPIED